MYTVAVMPTITGRENSFVRAMSSIEPQVDLLVTVLNHPLGSAAKLDIGRTKGDDSILFFCDDDLEYPPDYVATMLDWLEAWDYEAIVTCHGRVLRSSHFLDYKEAYYSLKMTSGAWLNYPGGCALAMHSKLSPPKASVKNTEEAVLAVWAQKTKTPIWLVPHRANWLTYLLDRDAETIFKEESQYSFTRRNGVLAEHNGSWEVYHGKGLL